MKIDVKSLLVAVVIAVVVALAAAQWLGAQFWTTIVLILVAMMVNGLIAHFEDQRLGGFENPRTEKKDSPAENEPPNAGP
jgi:undecaprenyl pyrophosphate phosphatase UppP